MSSAFTDAALLSAVTCIAGMLLGGWVGYAIGYLAGASAMRADRDAEIAAMMERVKARTWGLT